MNEPDEIPPRLRWPRYAAAGVVLWIVLAVIWMTVAVKKLERERDFTSPLPASAPAR